MSVIEILQSEGTRTGHVNNLVATATPEQRQEAYTEAVNALTNAFLEHRIYNDERAKTVEANRLEAEQKQAELVASRVAAFTAYGQPTIIPNIERFLKGYFGGKITRKPDGTIEARLDYPGKVHAAFTGLPETLARLEDKHGFSKVAVTVNHANGEESHIYRWGSQLFVNDFLTGGRFINGVLAIRYSASIANGDRITLDPTALDSEGLVPLTPQDCQNHIASIHDANDDIRRFTLL